MRKRDSAHPNIPDFTKGFGCGAIREGGELAILKIALVGICVLSCFPSGIWKRRYPAQIEKWLFFADPWFHFCATSGLK